MIAGGGFFAWRRLVLLSCGVRVRGAIEAWERQRDIDNPETFHFFPLVRYVDASGASRTMRVDRGFSSEKYPVGHPWEIRYDRLRPERACEASPFWMFAGAAAMLAMGFAALWIALVDMG